MDCNLFVLQFSMRVNSLLRIAFDSAYEVPFGINVFILLLGIVWLVFDFEQWMFYILGFCIVSGILCLLYLLTKGRGIGGGDIKLMATAGLLLGWDLILIAFILGCFFGSVMHIIRMKLQGEGRVLAMEPYISMGDCGIRLAWDSITGMVYELF